MFVINFNYTLLEYYTFKIFAVPNFQKNNIIMYKFNFANQISFDTHTFYETISKFQYCKMKILY